MISTTHLSVDRIIIKTEIFKNHVEIHSVEFNSFSQKKKKSVQKMCQKVRDSLWSC